MKGSSHNNNNNNNNTTKEGHHDTSTSNTATAATRMNRNVLQRKNLRHPQTSTSKSKSLLQQRLRERANSSSSSHIDSNSKSASNAAVRTTMNASLNALLNKIPTSTANTTTATNTSTSTSASAGSQQWRTRRNLQTAKGAASSNNNKDDDPQYTQMDSHLEHPHESEYNDDDETDHLVAVDIQKLALESQEVHHHNTTATATTTHTSAMTDTNTSSYRPPPRPSLTPHTTTTTHNDTNDPNNDFEIIEEEEEEQDPNSSYLQNINENSNPRNVNPSAVAAVRTLLHSPNPNNLNMNVNPSTSLSTSLNESQWYKYKEDLNIFSDSGERERERERERELNATISSPSTLPPPRNLSFSHTTTTNNNNNNIHKTTLDNSVSNNNTTHNNNSNTTWKRSYSWNNHDNSHDNDGDKAPKTPASSSSPMRDIKDLLSSVSSINRTYNTPLPTTTTSSSNFTTTQNAHVRMGAGDINAGNNAGTGSDVIQSQQSHKTKLLASLQKRYPNVKSASNLGSTGTTPKHIFNSSSVSVASTVSASSLPNMHLNHMSHMNNLNHVSNVRSNQKRTTTATTATTTSTPLPIYDVPPTPLLSSLDTHHPPLPSSYNKNPYVEPPPNPPSESISSPSPPKIVENAPPHHYPKINITSISIDSIYSIDALCIPYDTDIMLKAHFVSGNAGMVSLKVKPQYSYSFHNQSNNHPSNNNTHPKEDNPLTSQRFEANVNGVGLGSSDYEIFKIVPVTTTHNHHHHHHQASKQIQMQMQMQMVHYGDTIALISNVAYDRALGVRHYDLSRNSSSVTSSSSSTAPNNKYEMGFFRSLLGQAEKWVVLWGGSTRTYPIELGVNYANMNNMSGGDEDEETRKWRRRPVRSGEPIVLRNVITGGLLALQQSSSCSSGFTLQMLTSSSTSSGQPNNVYPSHAYHHPATEQYKYIIPGRLETWHMVPLHTPPCPRWNNDPNRPFLNASHVLYPRRHDDDDDVDDEGILQHLFGALDGAATSNVNVNADAEVKVDADEPLGNKTLAEQELWLLEEVIGALMGLEGTYIKVTSKHKDTAPNKNYGYHRHPNHLLKESSPQSPHQFVSQQEFLSMSSPSPGGSGGGGGINANSPPSSLQDVVFTLIEHPRQHKHKHKHKHNNHKPTQPTTARPTIPIDRSLVHIVQQILPLATYYTRVNAFVLSRRVRYEYGLVAHALVSAINSILQEYLVFVCQMEHLFLSISLENKLTLQKLHCFIQPSLRTMQILQHVTEQCYNVKGGALLNVLYHMLHHSYQGDGGAQDILNFCIQQAAKPYMEMLSLWIGTGQLQDPYGEFFIVHGGCSNNNNNSNNRNKERMQVLNGDDWDDLYRLHEHNIFQSLLEWTGENVPFQILTTGKYLTVFRQSHPTTNRISFSSSSLSSSRHFNLQQPSQQRTSISLDMGGIRMTEQIQSAFQDAASSLLRFIMEEHSLMDRLQSIKRYFLLNQGDFFVQFLDLAEEELLQEMSQVSAGRVQSLLGMAMQLGGGSTSMTTTGTGGFGEDTFRNGLTCDFATTSLVNHLDTIHARDGGIVGGSHDEPTRTPKRTVYGSQTELTGVEAFMLDYKAQWPLSLVISQKAIASYQLIFRHLFFSKHVERRLFETWLDHQTIKELNLRSILGPTYLLRQRMLHFMQNFVYYVMCEVIEPHWHQMKKNMKHSKTIDEVLLYHNKFLAATHEECLLKNRDLLRTLTKIMQTCLLFSDQMKRFAKSTKLDEENMKIAVEERRKRISSGDKPKKMRSIMRAVRAERHKRISALTARMQKAIQSDNYQKMIERFIQVFDSQISDFMKQLMADSHTHYHSHLSNLCTRLDFNGFVTRSMKTR